MIEKSLLIIGLKILHDTANDITYYYTDEMLLQGFIFEESFSKPDEKYINVLHVNQQNDIVINTSKYTVYWDRPLENIQIYRIIKDILSLYKRLSKEEFTDVLDSISNSYISSNMQSSAIKRDKMIENFYSQYEFVLSTNEKKSV